MFGHYKDPVGKTNYRYMGNSFIRLLNLLTNVCSRLKTFFKKEGFINFLISSDGEEDQ